MNNWKWYKMHHLCFFQSLVQAEFGFWNGILFLSWSFLRFHHHLKYFRMEIDGIKQKCCHVHIRTIYYDRGISIHFRHSHLHQKNNFIIRKYFRWWWNLENDQERNNIPFQKPNRENQIHLYQQLIESEDEIKASDAIFKSL